MGSTLFAVLATRFEGAISRAVKDVACTRLGKSARGYVEFFSFFRYRLFEEEDDLVRSNIRWILIGRI